MSATLTVEVQLFARLREVCGQEARVQIAVVDGATVDDGFNVLCRRFAGARAFRGTLAVAINDEYAAWDQVLRQGDVLSFIPPVSGG